MKRNKVISGALAALLAVSVSSPASAAIDYSAFWTIADEQAKGIDRDKILVTQVENGAFSGVTNMLVAMQPRTSEWQGLCKEIGQAPCDLRSVLANKTKIYVPGLIMPLCESAKSPDCVESLTLIARDGTRVKAEFLRATEGITFAGNKEFNLPRSGTQLLFQAPGVLNAAGTDTYAVEFTQEFMYEGKKTPKYENIKVAVVPYVETERENALTPALVQGTPWFGRGEYTINQTPAPGTIFAEDGRVGKIANFEEGVGAEVAIHVHAKFGGWLRGRLSETEVSATTISSTQQRIVVSATSVEVPRIGGQITRQQFLKYSPFPVEIFDDNKGGGVGGDVSDPDGTFGWLKAIRAVSKDKALAVNRVWMFATVPTILNQQCFKSPGIQGIVSTNAALYAGAAPKYAGGFLNYRVGGLHYLPDGTKAIGSYDLVMRADVARCLYGFNKAPISATVTVTGDGDSTIATTTVGEKNGWLKLSANGFTFSAKTIKVKLTQKKQTTITCVASGKKSQKVTAATPKCPKGFKKK